MILPGFPRTVLPKPKGPIEVIGFDSSSTSGNPGLVSLPVPAGWVRGDVVVVVCVSGTASSTETFDSLLTESYRDTAAPGATVLFRVMQSGDPSSFSCTTGSNSNRRYCTILMRNAGTVASASGQRQATGVSNSFVVNGFTASAGDMMLLIATALNTTAATPPSGMTTDINDSSSTPTLVAAHQLIPTAGPTGTRTISYASSNGARHAVMVRVTR